MSKIKEWWGKLPSFVKSGLITLVGTTITAFLTLSVEFLQDVVVWFPSLFDESDAVIEVPDVGAFADALYSLGVGFVTGVGFFLWRLAQSKLPWFFGNPPLFDPPTNPDA